MQSFEQVIVLVVMIVSAIKMYEVIQILIETVNVILLEVIAI